MDNGGEWVLGNVTDRVVDDDRRRTRAESLFHPRAGGDVRGGMWGPQQVEVRVSGMRLT